MASHIRDLREEHHSMEGQVGRRVGGVDVHREIDEYNGCSRLIPGVLVRAQRYFDVALLERGSRSNTFDWITL